MPATLRLLRARPGFAAVVLLTLALGIGAPTAVFSVVHAVLLRPLPYPEPHRLVRFRIDARHPQGNASFDALPAAEALEWGLQSETLSGMALYNDRALTLITADGPDRLSGTSATPNLFEVVGVPPALGRAFDPATTDARQIILSDATWRRYFAARSDVVGRPVLLDGESFLVRGVMPRDFEFPTPDAAFWVPLVITPGGSRGMLLPAIARLRADATVPAVLDEGRRILDDGGDRQAERTLIVRTLHEQLVGRVERVLWIVFAAVGLVSSIAATNLALLLLVRGAGRAHEFGVRLALGASRAQLARQLGGEAVTLAALGGTIGLLMTFGLLRVLVRTAPAQVPRLQDVAVDGPVLAFAIALTLLTSAVFALLSAGRTIALGAATLSARLAGDSRLASPRSPRRRMQILAALELALTMVLLVAAGVLLRSFLALALINQGFDPSNAVALRVSLPPASYPGVEARAGFHQQLLDQLRQMPGVDRAGLITSMPNRQASGRFDFNRQAPVVRDPLTRQVAEVRMATAGFFGAMGIPIRGREFSPADVDGAEPVVIISEQLAQLHFPSGDGVGQMLYSGAAGSVRVIGIAADVLPADGSAAAPSAYLPLPQSSDILQWFSSMNVILRGDDAEALIRSARAAVASLDAGVPVFAARTLDEDIAGLVAGPRYVATVLAAFAGVALVIAAVGVYGVMAYATGQRRREMGIRLALGATRAQVTATMMRDGFAIVGSGLALGLIAALWLSQLLTGLLHEVPPVDGVALAGVGALLCAAALGAAYWPTRQATRVNATETLRGE